jgi:hypothetical protein
MQHAITIGDLVYWSGGVLILLGVCAVGYWFLASLGRGMSR